MPASLTCCQPARFGVALARQQRLDAVPSRLRSSAARAKTAAASGGASGGCVRARPPRRRLSFRAPTRLNPACVAARAGRRAGAPARLSGRT
jgi:hypothetical protein